MSQIRIEDHQSVQLLLSLRDGLMSPTARIRKSTFSGIVAALKGLRITGSKDKIESLWEGIDHNGAHWFMAETQSVKAEKAAGVPPGEDPIGFKPISQMSLESSESKALKSIIASLKLVDEGENYHMCELAKQLTAVHKAIFESPPKINTRATSVLNDTLIRTEIDFRSDLIDDANRIASSAVARIMEGLKDSSLPEKFSLRELADFSTDIALDISREIQLYASSPK